MRIVFLAIVVAAAACGRVQPPATVCGATTSLRLEVQADRFLVDGQPRFLVLASYFDAMRAPEAAIESDFAFLKQKGIDGVRIFPTWIHEAGLAGAQDAGATLLDADGRIRSEERWTHLAMVLTHAASCGFVVDLTMTRDMLNTVAPPFTVDEYRGDPALTSCRTGDGSFGRGLSELACRLRQPEYSHVVVDLQNERNAGNAGMHLDMEELRGLRDAVKAVDPSRLIMVSHGGGNTADALAAARDARLDILAFHDEQRENWFAGTAAHVVSLKTANLPIYVQEGGRATEPGERFRGAECEATGENPLVRALQEAERSGAAAWTFHTDAGFRLDTQSFQQEIARCRREADFLDNLGIVLSR